MSEWIDLDRLENLCRRQRETGHPHDIGDADVLEPMIAAIRAAMAYREHDENRFSIESSQDKMHEWVNREWDLRCDLDESLAPFRPEGE